MLVLPIKRKWFNMIVSGEKREEYREISPYYKSRFKNLFSMYPYSYIPTGYDKQQLVLRNGYSKNSPSCVITAFLDTGKGNPDWGAVEGKEYYILKIVDRQVV